MKKSQHLVANRPTDQYQTNDFVIYQEQQEFTPYLSALAQGLIGGAEKLRGLPERPIDQFVASCLEEAAFGLNEARFKLETSQHHGSVTSNRPSSIIYSTLYIVGIFFGKIDQHIKLKRPSDHDPPRIGE